MLEAKPSEGYHTGLCTGRILLYLPKLKSPLKSAKHYIFKYKSLGHLLLKVYKKVYGRYIQPLSLDFNEEKQRELNYLDLLAKNVNATCLSKNLACLSLTSFFNV
jgi:hypothetical protein